MECIGVASGCGEQEVGVASGSGWNLWVWLLGVVVRRYIDFLIQLIPTPLVSVLFYSSIPTFCSFFKMFFVLVPVLSFYILYVEIIFALQSSLQYIALYVVIPYCSNEPQVHVWSCSSSVSQVTSGYTGGSPPVGPRGTWT